MLEIDFCNLDDKETNQLQVTREVVLMLNQTSETVPVCLALEDSSIELESERNSFLRFLIE